jgi:hypothetical protein
MDRLNESCPICTVGKNDLLSGGGVSCFHCSVCGWTECRINKPEEGYTPEGYVKEHLKAVEARLRKYYNVGNGGGK